MYKLCKTAESTMRQRQIERGLLALMKTKAFDDITISELCLSLNMPRKAFYRYFDSKEDALHALLEHTFNEYEGFTEPNTQKTVRTLAGDLERFFRFWLHQKDLLDALEKNRLTSLLVEHAIRYSGTDEAILNKFLPDEPRTMQREIIKFAICGLMSSMIEWHFGGFKESVGTMAQNMCRMFSKPLFPALGNY